jgi:hypothetical protein
LAGVGTLDPTKTYSVSYAVAGAEGQGIPGVGAPNTAYWLYDTAAPPPLSQYFNHIASGVTFSTITSFELNDDDYFNSNQFDWLEYARTTALAGNVGFLSVTNILYPSQQAIFTISSVVDNSGTHTINVTFLGGYDIPLAGLTIFDVFAFSYIFNGAGGGGTIGVYYPDISTPIDLATNTMVFTGSGVSVTQISPSDVQISIASSSKGAVLAQIRSLSTSTTLSPFTVGSFTIPYNGTITGWTIFSDVSGSCSVDFLADDYASYPPTTSLFSGNNPTLTANVKNELLGLSIPVVAGDVLLCNLVSVSGSLSRIDVTLLITKS